MPLTHHLRTPISQFLFDSSHCHQAFVQHNYNRPRALNQSHRPRRRHNSSYGYSHDHGYTRKARFSTRSQSLASSREPTFYEVLDVPVTATPAEIKKKFYSLSLQHHPDRNPNDPSASSRFAKISSAYQTLSNSTKRSTYDRDNGIHAYTSQSTHSTANPGQHPMGSHSSHASYFGSRPASGLSKRRGVFRGPPPSFYAHGGYGKRRAPSMNNTGGFASTGSAAGGAGAAGGKAKGKDDDPTAFIDRNSVPHFNARGHYRTQTAEDARRQERRSRETLDINEQYIGGRGDFAMRFVIVMSILLGAAGLTGFMRWPNATGGSGVEKAGKTKRANDG
ncbi:DnaJ domain protein [Aspergillus undulatus]|uniref:DnaJ domain protein n=1 Tax=Aspergillus undulatus TaxID=1810928 RepID=UPI003CCD2D36